MPRKNTPTVTPRAYEHVSTMVGYWDASLRSRFANQAYARRFDIDAAQIPGMHMRDVLGELAYRLEQPYLEAALSGQEQCFERVTPAGVGLRVTLTRYIPEIAAGKVLGFYAMLTDNSHAHELELASREQAEQLRIAEAVFESPQGTLITDPAHTILRVNRAFTDITGYSAAEAIGQTPRLLNSRRHGPAFYAAIWDSIEQTGNWKGEIWNRYKSGKLHSELLSITAVKDEAGQVSHYVGAFSDTLPYKAAEEHIQNLAFSDPLTGLPNRLHLVVLLQQMQLVEAKIKRQDALLLVGLDQFNNLNEIMGHEKSNLLLQGAAQRLGDCIRKSDTLVRLGDNSFVVLLQDLSTQPQQAADEVRAAAGKFLLALNRPYRVGGADFYSGASIGIAMLDAQLPQSPDVSLNQAELAMHCARDSGRNMVCFFEPQMQAQASARAALESELQDALLKDQFTLEYQAQVTFEGRITGAEALLRWQHPERGMVAPGDFIALAEESGLIVPLGQWVLQAACRQLALWASAPEMAALTLAINVSAHQFHQTDFVEQVLSALALSGARAQRLKLELTESSFVTNVAGLIEKMDALRGRGVSFALDDFGTGYSSLALLKKLPMDQIKIDRVFVHNILRDADDAAIAEMVISLANNMGLEVIAEGVETQAQRDFLAGLGCRNYQGYLYSLSLPVPAFEAYVKAV